MQSVDRGLTSLIDLTAAGCVLLSRSASEEIAIRFFLSLAMAILPLWPSGMADPWYEVVRPIWSDVVHILNRLTEGGTLDDLLSTSGIVTRENCSDFYIVESEKDFKIFPEVYLVAASLGGETSFTSFLSLLKSWAFPGSQPLAHELERLWTNDKKKHVPKKSTASSPLRKFCSLCGTKDKNCKPLKQPPSIKRSPVYLGLVTLSLFYLKVGDVNCSYTNCRLQGTSWLHFEVPQSTYPIGSTMGWFPKRSTAISARRPVQLHAKTWSYTHTPTWSLLNFSSRSLSCSSDSLSQRWETALQTSYVISKPSVVNLQTPKLTTSYRDSTQQMRWTLWQVRITSCFTYQESELEIARKKAVWRLWHSLVEPDKAAELSIFSGR